MIAPSLLQGSYGTLSLGGLTTAANTTLDFNLGATSSGGFYNGDLIAISSTGALSIAASTSIQFASLPTAVGDYRLLADSNAGAFSSANVSNFVLPTPPSIGELHVERDRRSGLSGPGRGQCFYVLRFRHLGFHGRARHGTTSANWQDGDNGLGFRALP